MEIFTNDHACQLGSCGDGVDCKALEKVLVVDSDTLPLDRETWTLARQHDKTYEARIKCRIVPSLFCRVTLIFGLIFVNIQAFAAQF